MDSPVLWCSLPQILPSFLIYLRIVGCSFSEYWQKFSGAGTQPEDLKKIELLQVSWVLEWS